MGTTPEQPIDRRAFLTGAGTAGVALALGGSGAALGAVAGAAPRKARSGLAGAIRGPVFTRGSKGFAAAAHVYNERYDSVLPRAVARPLDATDVRDAVRYLVAHGTRLRARSAATAMPATRRCRAAQCWTCATFGAYWSTAAPGPRRSASARR